MTSLKGQFLIATPELTDPNFAQSVLLMIHHDASGAMGVIINRPMDVTVAQACDQFSEDIEPAAQAVLSQKILYHGGPCETMLIALHAHPEYGGMEVIEGVYVSTEKGEVELTLNDPEAISKFVVGYAGWTAGQLEGECAGGSWRVASANDKRVFGFEPKLWDRLQAELSLGQWISVDRIPDDPSVN